MRRSAWGGVELSDNKHGCLKGTAIGCGVLVVLAIAAVFIGGGLMMRPFSRAVDTRSELEAEHGPIEKFVPSPSGAVPADRMETFLEVRRKLVAACAKFDRVEAQFHKMEEFDDQEEVSRTEVLKEAFKTTKSAMSMGPLMGEFFTLRNDALLEEGMGLGEFTYIWVVSYHDRIAGGGSESELFGPSLVNSRVRSDLLAMLVNQHSALKNEDPSSEELAPLKAEIAAMESDPRRLPWQDGLPDVITESIAPFRQRLDELWCGSTAPLELLINVKHGMAVESM